jgi:hypothetical protein
MKQRYILFRRGAAFYFEDTETRKQARLHAKDEAEAHTLLHVKNEALRQPMLNLQIARTYLAASVPAIGKRLWQEAWTRWARSRSGRPSSATRGRRWTRPLT